MRWYVIREGQTVGPVEGETVVQWGRAGQLVEGMHVRDESSGTWMPIEQSPFASFVAPRQHISRNKESIFNRALKWYELVAIIGIPVIALVGYVVFKKEDESTPIAPPPPIAAKSAEVPQTSSSGETQVQGPIVSLSPSVSGMRSWFEKMDYTFQSAPLATGIPRLIGQHEETMATIELIGRGDLLERTSLMLGFSRDDPGGLVHNTAGIIVFMRELGWPDGTKWVTQHATTGGKINKDGVTYEINVIQDTGVMVLSAKPDLNNSELQRLIGLKQNLEAASASTSTPALKRVGSQE